MKIAIAQLNPVVGDISGNLEKLKKAVSSLESDVDLILFSELFLVGYPPRDLLQKSHIIDEVEEAIESIKALSKEKEGLGILVGAPVRSSKDSEKSLFNAALLIADGEICGTVTKTLLPTYDVFDETRYFESSKENKVVEFKGEKLGITICEDMWNVPEVWREPSYSKDPVGELVKQGANILINISASPYFMGKEEVREKLIQTHAKKHARPFVHLNQVGANDELIFDGRSLAVDKDGNIIQSLKGFEEAVVTIDSDEEGKQESLKEIEVSESVYQALALGIRDYVRKCGFKKVVVGLSGGIDSALTCCLAAQAVGPKNVLGISMPSPYSSEGSYKDSEKLAKNLGIEFKIIEISDIFSTYQKNLKQHWNGTEGGLAEENLQARIRGDILMAFSNKYNYLLLSTGNKSEMAVGYCTLYGDMSGGLSVISDIPKTFVYHLSHYVNRKGEIIPNEIFEKPPSAELRPDQTDQDTLPPYDLLDQILYYYVEKDYSEKDIIDENIDPETVRWVVQAVKRNEYKRKQAAPGLKVTPKAFGMGRRIPIAAKYSS